MAQTYVYQGKFVPICGGYGRIHLLSLGMGSVRAHPGSRQGGSNSRKSAEEAIGSGRVGLVLILVRWTSHPDVGALKAACRAAGVECRVCSAGFASVREELQAVGEARKAAYGRLIGTRAGIKHTHSRKWRKKVRSNDPRARCPPAAGSGA